MWHNKPVQINSKDIGSNIISSDVLYNKVVTDIENSRFKLKYKVLYSKDVSREKMIEILDFININYIGAYDSNSYKFIYTIDLFEFYCRDAMILEFYPELNDKIVGYIIGKPSEIYLYGNIIKTSESNFLCLVPKLRNLGLGPFIINSLTKEFINNWSIITSHYTISEKIKSPFFGEKKFCNRYINLNNLYNSGYISLTTDIIKKYSKFEFPKYFSKWDIKYINGDIKEDDKECIKVLYDKYIEYCKKTYEIFELIDLDEFSDVFYNKSFYNFIIYDSNGIIKGYVCLFKLDLFNPSRERLISNGYYYYIFFDDIRILEYVNKFICDNDIFDLVTFSDIFDVNYDDIKCVKNSSMFRYYFYNIRCPVIKNDKNGLITI